MKVVFRLLLLVFVCSFLENCKSPANPENVPQKAIQLSMDFQRIDSDPYDGFRVTATVLNDGKAVSGFTLKAVVSKGQSSAVVDQKNGTYVFTVTPDRTGVHAVTVTCNGVSLKREILVLKNVLSGSGQPLLVPGSVNTEGYEDGVFVTADGKYLFVQYGPVYFSGIFLHADICSEKGWSGYDLVGGEDNPDAKWVFQTIGPYTSPLRPDFPTGGIQNGKLKHLKSIVIPGQVNGIVNFPTVIYGFKRQKDGTYGEPFLVAFRDKNGINAPFGISVVETGTNEALVALSWNNYFNDLGDDKPDVYFGKFELGKNINLGDVEYGTGPSELFNAIDSKIIPVGFSSHVGVQGNPHLYKDNNGKSTSIWTDDEQVTKDISVYCLESGVFPAGKWKLLTLPFPVNTTSSESQPFFTGKRLYLNRDVRIVYHEYAGPHDLQGYADPRNWGPEIEVLSAGETGVGTIFGVGEPSVCQLDGIEYLYFAYVECRAEGQVAARYDYDLGAAFLPLP